MLLLPRLRSDIDLVPARTPKGDALVIRDPLGIVPRNAALTIEVARQLAFFDGSSTAGDLQVAMTRERGGELVFSSEVEKLVDRLSRLGLLETANYFKAREKIIAAFTASPERPPALAGISYPDNAQTLSRELDTMLAAPGEAPSSGIHKVIALAAPHLDLRVAGKIYGTAYRAIACLEPSSILVLGTGHDLEPGRRYCLTDKTFVTPLGKVKADGEAVMTLREAGGDILHENDFPHKNEHSIELQIIFLQCLFPMADIPVISVLCGTLDDFFIGDRRPEDDPWIASFIGALRNWVDTPPPGKLVVAGVDLSHVGPKFGDCEPAKAMEEDTRKHDQKIMGALEKGEAGLLFDTDAAEKGRFNVCGFTALWTLLSIIPGAEGKVLAYDLWHEKSSHSAVSCAAVIFSRSGD